MDAVDFFRMIDEEKKRDEEKRKLLAEESASYDTSWSDIPLRKFRSRSLNRKKNLKKLRRKNNS
jgi:hypothetical protein